jgi:polysaccharide biosynthesis/export protein
MRLVVGGIAVAILWVGLTHAQVPMSAGDMPAADPRLSGSGTTGIPVKVPGSTEVMGAESTGTSSAAASIALEQPIDPQTYICGVGDTFELNFWGQQNFRLKVAADLEGRVFISKVGFVSVAGKTLSAVRIEVNNKVRANYPGLQFALTLLAPRTFIVHVADNVIRPGGYTASPVERVSTVLARAGGATGSRRRISIKRRTGSVITADLVMYELTGDTRHNPYVLDGDVITVPFAGVMTTIAGAVRRPGTYELIGNKDVAELLELAGGFTSSVVRSLPIRIVRRNKVQQEQFIDLAFDGQTPQNRELRDDDRVVVRGSDEVQRTVQLIGAVVAAESLDAATTAKRLPFIEGDTVQSMIDRAGGIKAPGDLSRSYISRPKPEGPPELIALDLEALLVRRDFRADKPVKMGDLIVVPPMQYSVRVEGAVARAGLYPYNPKFGIAEYVTTAGGRTRSARDIGEAKLIESSGRTHEFSPNLKPSPGDAILIPERNFTRPEIVQIAISAAGLILSGIAITLAATR